jgi:hypothetical protein
VHDTSELLALLDERFERVHFERGAYFFPELAEPGEEDELAAIRDDRIRPAARRPRRTPARQECWMIRAQPSMPPLGSLPFAP